MAIKATVHKAALQIADMDRGLYADHAFTLALQPSETEERLMMRVLAFALQVPSDDHDGGLLMARGLTDTEEPDLWQKDLTGQIKHWIEVGLPADDRRLSKACGRADRVTLYAYGNSAPIWWAGMESKVARLRNLSVWHVPHPQSQELAALARRSMQLQVTVQDGQVWVSDSGQTAELSPVAWKTGTP